MSDPALCQPHLLAHDLLWVADAELVRDLESGFQALRESQRRWRPLVGHVATPGPEFLQPFLTAADDLGRTDDCQARRCISHRHVGKLAVQVWRQFA